MRVMRTVKALLIALFCVLFAISGLTAEIVLKSGKILCADDLPWVSGDVLKFHLDGQLAAVFLARVDLDKTRIGKSPKRKPKQTPTPQTLPANARVEKSKVYTNEDLEKLNREVQMGDNSLPSVPGREPESSAFGTPAGKDWLEFDPAAGGNSRESLEEIQRQLEANQQDLDTGGEKFIRNRNDWDWMGGRSGSAINQEAYMKEKERLLNERQKLLEEQRKLGGGSEKPDPILDRPQPPRQDPGSHVPSDGSGSEVPTTSAGDELTVRTY